MLINESGLVRCIKRAYSCLLYTSDPLLFGVVVAGGQRPVGRLRPPQGLAKP